MKLATHVIVYAGRHYGKRHKVLALDEFYSGSIKAIHEETGYVITIPACDCEAA